MKRIILTITLISVTLLLTSCFATRPAIKDIHDNESNFYGKSLIVSGTVTDVQKLPFREDGIFRIFDKENNSIWVYREEGTLPERGDKVSAAGKLRKEHDFRKKLLGPVLIEER